MIHRLHNPVRPYAWGSRTHIAAFTSTELGDQPAAEMWIGAHRSAPSRVGDQSGPRLDDVIAADPDRALGHQVRARHGDRLPYLMKLLAASQPLSLQVHPGSDRARRGFQEQEAAGIAVDACDRSYPDPSHKPELLFALTRFEGMAGFRDLGSTAAVLRRFGLGWLDDVAQALEGAQPPESVLRSVVTQWLDMSPADVRVRLHEVRAAAIAAEASARHAARSHRPAAIDAAGGSREMMRVCAATVPLIDRYPDDPGVLVTLLLNHLVLAPGEAMFVGPGVVHAYTVGFGLEIMATSDNVLRAGLTGKHVDIQGLLEVADFRPQPPPRCQPDHEGALTRFSPDAEEFELYVMDLGSTPVRLPRGTPRLVLGLDGSVDVRSHDDHVTLNRGEAAFVGATAGAEFAGAGRAAVGQSPLPRTGSVA